ncbi:MAG: NUDIX hydrolase [Alteromonadaceae bacterium]|nr:NUDIX hydrolase [Alteromonadaceae bacterium]
MNDKNSHQISDPVNSPANKESTEAEFLKTYNIHEFDIPLTSVDMAIFTIEHDALKVLLVKRAQFPAKGQWALPGGFINLEDDNTLSDTASRKLKEKTGVDIAHLEQVSTFGGLNRDPRGWSVTIAYMALISCKNIVLKSNETSEDIVWVAIENVNKNYKLAFDHNTILTQCYQRLKSKVQYTSLPINLLPRAFTLSELQKTFELILGYPIEKKSFRRRVLGADIIAKTGEMRVGSNRPAKLYYANASGKEHLFQRNIEGPR